MLLIIAAATQFVQIRTLLRVKGDAINRIEGENWVCGEHIKACGCFSYYSGVGRVVKPFRPLYCSQYSVCAQ